MSTISVNPTLKGSVLIIEDNLLNLDMATELLNLAGYVTYQAEDALVGIDLAREMHPDLILMDLHMPHTDGFTATQMLKADPALKNIPIVAFTALAMREDQEKAIASGCAGVISKPIDVHRFADMVAQYMPPPSSEKDSISSRTPVISPHLTVESIKTVTSPTRYLDSIYSAQQPLSFASEETDPAIDEAGLHTILVVDDNPMNVELLKDALDSMGQNVLSAYNGADALQMVQQQKPDLIVLDIMMPNMDGYQVLEHLQTDANTADIPVIFISALNKTQDLVRGLKHGTYDYITKPFKVEEVKARIFAVLRIKDLQDTLKQEKEKLDKIFQFSADGMALLDTQRYIVSANPIFARLFNLTLSPEGTPLEKLNFYSLVGCQCAENQPCPVHTPQLALVPEEKTDDGTVLLESLVTHNLYDKTRYLNIHGAWVTGYGQKIEGYVVVLSDVTEQKDIENAKETFVATLTHDLKTPIRAEYQALDMLKNDIFGPLSPEQREMLDEIIHSNRYMSNLVDSLLTTYKYDEGKLELKLEQTDLNQLIREDVAPALKTLAKQKQQTLVLNLADQLPAVFVDKMEMQRVLNNLIQNALTFTPRNGTITLMTQPIDDNIKVSIQDTGPGIDAETRAILFERYKSMAKKFKQVGTGLGLYLSKKIIEAHQGHIGVESEVGQGSHFYFTLPVSKTS